MQINTNERDNPTMMKILQRVMTLSKTGFCNYNFADNTHFFCDNLFSWFSIREQDLIREEGLFSLLALNTRDEIDKRIQAAIDHKKQKIELKISITLDKRINSVNKGVCSFKINLDISYDSAGRPVDMLVIVHDITQYENTKSLLQREKSQALKNAQLRATQIAHLSHEIRTPIGGIVGMTDVLLSENHSEKTKEKLKIIKQSAEIMMNTLTSTLDHCKIMANGISLNPKNTSPKALLESTILFWRDKAKQNGITIVQDLSPDIPEIISIDEFRIKQCLNNLLSNSIKFTTGGKIKILMKTARNNSDKDQLAIIVSDTGIGMTAQQQRHIFEPFAQADDDIAPKFGGTGLGMSITKKIVESMGGYIIVKSQKDVGTTIGIILPMKSVTKFTAKTAQKNMNNTSKKNPEQLINSPTTRREKILIVDDIPTNRVVLEYMLRDTYDNLFFAENGQEAIKVLDNNMIDLILMDIHMPVLNGLETAKAIRSSNKVYTDVPIVMVTADKEYHNCVSICYDDVISKPVGKRTLLYTIEKILANRRQRGENLKQICA